MALSVTDITLFALLLNQTYLAVRAIRARQKLTQRLDAAVVRHATELADVAAYADAASRYIGCRRPGLVGLYTAQPRFVWPTDHTRQPAPAPDCLHIDPRVLDLREPDGEPWWVAVCVRCAGRWQTGDRDVPEQVLDRVHTELDRHMVALTAPTDAGTLHAGRRRP